MGFATDRALLTLAIGAGAALVLVLLVWVCRPTDGGYGFPTWTRQASGATQSPAPPTTTPKLTPVLSHCD